MLAADRITVCSARSAAAPVIAGFLARGRARRAGGGHRADRTRQDDPRARALGTDSGAAKVACLDRRRPLELRSPERRRIAVVLQEPTAQLTQPTVREEVEFVARNLGSRTPVGGRTNGSSASASRRKRPTLPLQLSAGRQQLVLLASALAADPEFLVVDEGTAHLDSSTRCGFWRGGVAGRARSRGPVGDPDRIGSPAGPTGWWRWENPARPPLLRVRHARCRVTAAASVPRSLPIEGGRRPRRSRSGASPELIVPASGVARQSSGPTAPERPLLLEALAGLTVDRAGPDRSRDAIPTPAILAAQYPELGVFNELVENGAGLGGGSPGQAQSGGSGGSCGECFERDRMRRGPSRGGGPGASRAGSDAWSTSWRHWSPRRV